MNYMLLGSAIRQFFAEPVTYKSAFESYIMTTGLYPDFHLGRFFLLIKVDLFTEKWTFFHKWGVLQSLQSPPWVRACDHAHACV